MKKEIKTLLYLVILLFATYSFSQALGYNNNRIAVSADGNNQPDLSPEDSFATADPDDWGGSPTALAIIANERLQSKLVHFSYNNFMSSPRHTTAKNEMAIGVNRAITEWNFDANRFFDVPENKTTAINHLANELKKSTASNPLYFIHMGPAEFLYRAVKKTVDDGKINALSHVYIISHSGYNDNYKRRSTHHNMAETRNLSGGRLNYKKIADQNACKNPAVLWCSERNSTPFLWIKNHPNPKFNWLYNRYLQHPFGKGFDVSDAGMIWYLFNNDAFGNLSKFKDAIVNSDVFSNSGDPSPPTDTNCVIEEKDGLLVFEAERFKATGDWKVANDNDASGGKFLFYDGFNSYQTPNLSSIATYQFKINNPGTYTFKWTMRQPKGEQGGDLGNDAWFDFTDAQASGGATQLTKYEKFVGRSDDTFVFNGQVDLHAQGQPWVRVNFPAAGTYTLKLAGRSKGFEVDRIILYKGMTFAEAEVEISKIEETQTCVTNADVFFIVNRQTGKKIRPQTDADGSRVVQINASAAGDYVKWEEVPTSGGYFYLKNKQTGKYFRPANDNDGALLEQRPTTYSGNYTQWKKVPTSNGYFYLENRQTGKYFRPVDSNNDSPMEQRPTSYSGNYTQWKFESTSSKILNEIDSFEVTAYVVSSQLRIEIPESGTVSAVVYDLGGQQVFSNKLQKVAAGESIIELIGLTHGFYIAKVNYNGKTVVLKFAL